MKRQLLLCTLLTLFGIALLVVSPSVIAAFSKTSSPVVTGHMSQPFALMIQDSDEISQSTIQRGFDLAPVTLNLKGRNRSLVGLGSYIVNTGGCNDCHTNPPYLLGHDPFAGEPEQINVPCYLSGGAPFGPVLRSANLTPDANGLPAGLTLDVFIHTLRTGEDPDGGGLLEVMPWPVFGKKTTRDLSAIYEYLSAIPSRPSCLPEP
jgi:hypothetical protein